MTLDTLVTVVKKTTYPHERMSWELVDLFAEGIPNTPSGNSAWEWPETPTIIANLESYGYGIVMIKDESKNPTETAKDRPAWEYAKLFRDFSRNLYLRKRAGELDGNISGILIPQLSIITAGNAGIALARRFKQHWLPPPNLLVDRAAPQSIYDGLKGEYANVFAVDISARALTSEDIKQLTNNQGGIDITSLNIAQPQIEFYDWFAHEVFNKSPTHIFAPYGSGNLYENLLTWQEITARNAAARKRDRRLKVDPEKVVAMSILGSEPDNVMSSAAALTKSFAPFTLYHENDIKGARAFEFSGLLTGIYQVNEARITEAHELMSRFCKTGPSGSAGMALYMQMFDNVAVKDNDRPLIVNTGKGLL